MYFYSMKVFHISNTSRLSKEKFETVYRAYYSRLFYYCFQFISDEEASKDIINDVFEKVWTQRHELKEETLSTFLYTLVRNKCLDYIKHKKVEQQYTELYELITYEEPEDHELYEQQISQIEKIISNLGEPTKSIFTKCYFLNKKYAEVAEEYNISTNGVKKHIMKVLRLMRENFETKK